MNKLLILCVMLAASLAFATCKKKQPAMKSGLEGCDCAKEVSADFLMEEQSTIFDQFAKYAITDTIFGGTKVRFTASEDSAAEYKWILGSQTVYGKSVRRTFPVAFVGQNLPIILVVRKKANNLCLPNDDGYDSIIKYIHVKQPPNELVDNPDFGAFEGTFRVKSPHLPDSFDVGIDMFFYSVPFSGCAGYATACRTVYFTNLEGDGLDYSSVVCEASSFRRLWTQSSTRIFGDLRRAEGSFFYRMDKIIEMNFKTGNAGQTIQRNYLGRKLN